MGLNMSTKNQQMLKYMYVSEGLSREFNEVANDTQISTNVDALKSGFWPLT